MLDLDLFESTTNRIHMKRLAVEICIAFLARSVSQCEFRVKNGNDFEKNDLYYRLNVRPNINQTASTFWQTVIRKLAWDNEVLVIQSDTEDLLIADDFIHNEYAVLEDTFTNVVVKGYEFKRSFLQNEVIHLRFGNEKLSTLIDSIFKDYGDLFGRVLESQKRKNQIRGVVKIDGLLSKAEDQQQKLQTYINNIYKSIESKSVAIIPEQKAFEYKELNSAGGVGVGAVDEVGKVETAFLERACTAFGIPPNLIIGDKIDVQKQTTQYLNFTLSPLLKKLKDEMNVKFFKSSEYLGGRSIDIRKASYQSVFDLATRSINYDQWSHEWERN